MSRIVIIGAGSAIFARTLVDALKGGSAGAPRAALVPGGPAQAMPAQAPNENHSSEMPVRNAKPEAPNNDPEPIQVHTSVPTSMYTGTESNLNRGIGYGKGAGRHPSY